MRSILLVGWSPDTVTGIVPKGTSSGLHHFDTTANKTLGSDGFPVGDEVVELGYTDMLTDMFNAFDIKSQPKETFYDGYIVNEIMDACYRSAKSRRWEPVKLKIWRGREKTGKINALKDYDEYNLLVKEERMPDGSVKVILKNKKTGVITQKRF